MATIPERQVRARYDTECIIVYQAFSPEIADPALEAGRFVPPFRLSRMTWIKPSFLWMMHRSGWASRPGQERVLSIRMTRAGFEWALAHSCLTTFTPRVYSARDAWRAQMHLSPVRVQWDPERSLTQQPLPYRTIQIGLRGEAVVAYATAWIRAIEDITPRAHEIAALVATGELAQAEDLLPQETPYPLPAELASRIDAASDG